MTAHDSNLKKAIALKAKFEDVLANAKAKNKAKQALAKLAFDDPDLLRKVGLNPSDFPLPRSFVAVYGTVGNLLEVDADFKLLAASEGVLIMRARAEYQNLLLRAYGPIRTQVLSLISGPEWAKAIEIQKRIDTLYEDLNTLKYLRVKEKVSEAQVSSIDTEISRIQSLLEEARADRNTHRPVVSKERNALRKEHAAELRKLLSVTSGSELSLITNRLRNQVSPGRGANTADRKSILSTKDNSFVFLHDGDYSEVEAAAQQSLLASVEADWVDLAEMRPKYSPGKGKFPEFSIMDYERWNGEGALSVKMSQTERRTYVKDVLDGTSEWVRLTPLDPDHADLFGLSHRYLNPSSALSEEIAWLSNQPCRTPKQEKRLAHLLRREKSMVRGSRNNVYVYWQRKAPGEWFVIPVVLHRPLGDPTTKVARAKILRKKVGQKLETSVQITLVETRKTRELLTGKTIQIHSVPSLLEDGRYRVAILEQQDGTQTDFCLDASFGEAKEQEERLFSYLKEHWRRFSAKYDTLKEEDPDAVRCSVLPSNFDFNSRGQVRYAYRRWRSVLIANSPAVNQALTDILATIRDEHDRNKAEGGDYNGNYLGLWSRVMRLVRDKLGLQHSEAEMFAAVLLFVERYNHLYPWAVNRRNKMKRKRRDVYRIFAAKLAKEYDEVVFTSADRYNRDPEVAKIRRLTAPKSLGTIIKNAVEREGGTCKVQVFKKAKNSSRSPRARPPRR